MKLRRWMASTLPRMRRGGRKREPSPPARDCSTLHPAPTNTPSPGPTPGHVSHSDMETDKTAPTSSRVHTGGINGKERTGDCSLSNLIAYNYSLVTEDFQYLPPGAASRGSVGGCQSGGGGGSSRCDHGAAHTTMVTVHSPGPYGSPSTVKVNVTAHCRRSPNRPAARPDTLFRTQTSVDSCSSGLHDSSCASDFTYTNYPGDDGTSSSGCGASGCGSDGNYYTLPRARTRIRTNPWLPSPRASPLLTSPVTSPLASPVSAPRSPFFNWLGTSRADYSHAKSPSLKCNHCGSTLGSSSDSSDSESTLPRTARASAPYSKKKSKPKSSPIAEGKEVNIDLRRGTVVVKHHADLVEQGNFYEQEFESTLERKKASSNSLGSRDTLTDSTFESRDGLSMCDSFSSMDESGHSGVTNPRLSFYRDDESNDSEGTLCQEGATSLIANEWQDPVEHPTSSQPTNVEGDSNDLFTSTEIDFDAEVNVEEQTELDFSRVCDNDVDDVIISSSIASDLQSPSTPMSIDSMTDSAYDSSTFSSIATYSSHNIRNYYNDCDKWTSKTLPHTTKSSSHKDNRLPRTLGDIRSSLQEKVSQLRRDKLIVDEKVRQAQEEDRLRREEMLSFKKQLTTFRKQMLLNTLQELKSKLESQSVDLQAAYDRVIDRKWDDARRDKRLRNTTR